MSYNLNFAETTKVTKLAFQTNPVYESSGYVDIYVCADVWDMHILRVLKGYGLDYEESENEYILEINQIPLKRKGETITKSRLKEILMNDELENYDYFVFDSLDKVMDRIIDGIGYRIPKDEE